MASTKERSRRPSGRRRSSVRAEDGRFRDGLGLTILASIMGAVLVFWRGVVDVFSTPKLTLVLVGAVVVIGLVVLDAIANRRVLVPWGVGPALTVLFLVVAGVAAISSGLGARAVFGSYSRYVGFGPYLLYAVVAGGVFLVLDDAWLTRFLRTMTVTTGVVVVYGLLQIRGADPFRWTTNETRRAFSTLGQENFAAGFLAMALPLMVTLLLLEPRRSLWRRVGTAILLGSLITLWSTKSFQGGVVVVGLAPILFVNGPYLIRQVRRAPVALVVAAGLTLAAAAVVLAPRAARFGSRQVHLKGFAERGDLWRVAWGMAHGHFILGRGFGAYALEFPARRPLPFVLRYGPYQVSDAPHNVYLEHLVSGGGLLLAVYATLLAYTGYRLVKAFSGADRRRRLMLAGVGGAWLSYLGQAAVSIDVIPLALLGWVLTALVLAIATPSPVRRFGVAPPPRQSRVGVWAVAVVAVGLVLVVVGTRPLRADARAADAATAARVGNMAGALAAFRDATHLAPWEPTYQAGLAAQLLADKQPQEALGPGRRAAELGTDSPINALAFAALLKQLGRTEEARSWYDRAVRQDPHSALAVAAAGNFSLETGRYPKAAALMKTATELIPARVEYWTLYGEALAGLGDRDGARRAYNRALAVQVGYPPALQDLKLLDAPAPKG